MIRRPPRSTLFPLHDALPIFGACLERSRATGNGNSRVVELDVASFENVPELSIDHADIRGLGRSAVARSEEHTSELQSQSNLVCRLLLEKKKKKNIRTTYTKT